MKFLHVTFQTQYRDAIEALLVEQGVEQFVMYPREAGRDRDGKHDSTQAFPGSLAAVQGPIDDDRVDAVFEALRRFQESKRAHAHVDAAILPVERVLGPPDTPEDDA